MINIKTRWVIIFSFLYSWCWILPLHNPPWMSFYSDAWAAGIALIGGGFILVNNKNNIYKTNFTLPAIIILIISGQYFLNLITSAGIAWINLIYIGGFFLTILIGRAWGNRKSLSGGNFLFFSVFFGGIFSLLIQLHQLFSLEIFGDFIIRQNGNRFAANIGQPNQLGTLFLLSCLGCAWLYIKKYINRWVLLCSCILFLLGAALTQSRTVWVNVFFLLSIFLFKNKITEIKKLIPIILLLIFIYFSFVFLIPAAISTIKSDVIGEIEIRPFKDSARITIWKVYLEALMEKPFFGYGWGQVSHVQLFGRNHYEEANSGVLFLQIHNLIFDILLWNGLLIGIPIIIFFSFWLFIVFNKLKSIDDLLIFCFLSVLIIHSFFEFPLHYAYFIILFGLAVGIIDAKITFFKTIQLNKTTIYIYYALILCLFFKILKEYNHLENEFYKLRLSFNGIKNVENFNSGDVILLAHLRDYIYFARIDPKNNHSMDNIEFGERVISSYPTTLGIYKLILMYFYAGNFQKANEWYSTLKKISNENQINYIDSEFKKNEIVLDK